MNTHEIYVVGAVRPAIGTFGGSYKDVSPSHLAITLVRGELKRSACDPTAVGHVVVGNVIPTRFQGCLL